MLTHLDHIIIAQNDFAQAEKWAAFLGRKSSWQGSHPQQGTANHLFRLPDFYVELMVAHGEGGHAEQVRQHLAKHGEGVMGLSFACDDAEKLAAFWRGRGLSPSTPQAGEGRDEKTGAARKWRLVFLPPEQSGGLFVFAIEHQSPADSLPLLAPDGAGEIAGLDHLVVRAGNATASEGFYEAIGLRGGQRRETPGGNTIRFMHAGNAALEISGGDDRQGDSIWGVAWRVDDLAAAHKRLEMAGFNLSPMRKGRKRNSSVFTLRDAPAGIPTLIISHQKLRDEDDH